MKRRIAPLLVKGQSGTSPELSKNDEFDRCAMWKYLIGACTMRSPPPAGDTVDVSTATYTHTIASTELSAQWVDKGFDPKPHTTYYGRVLEIPTPRWSTYWGAKLHVPTNTEQPTTVRQRAWTSPIWYTPAAS